MRHMCFSIQGALASKDALRSFTADDGTPARPVEVRAFLRTQLAMGRRVLPMGDCDNFDYQAGCKGHTGQEPEKEDDHANR